MPRAGGTPERPAVFFDGPSDFRAWLEANHDTASELWMGLHKRHVTPRGLTYEQAVPEALCYGWIDSVVQRIDEDANRQRWTPRRRGSVWSTVNVAHVERLTAEGRMQPSGLAAYAAREADRAGIYSYEQAETGRFPPEYAGRLAAVPRAAAFWAGATPSYRKTCVHWVLSAKRAATRDRRMAQLVADCAAGELIKPLRYDVEPAWAARLRDQLGS
ncbi:MAG: YdeI/OmpD-associated family protein [Dermatophilaceae bacterium]